MTPESFDPPTLEALASLLPGYDLVAFVAQGGMGAVYKARQRSLDRDVAIKILPRELGADPEFRLSFETEAKAMARLNHPNLIGVYDFGDADGMPYIVMEYVPGKSLFHSAHNSPVEPRQAVTIVKRICDGLAHAHENGVIHRDIKPANILLTPKAEPKVGDFGLARPAGEGSTGLLMGTPGYTAPEIMRQPDHADHRSDIFALGVVLYELLIGRCPPYDVPAPPPSSIVGCDPALDAICAIATHPSADMRYPSAEKMSAALDQWLRGPNRAPAGPPPPPKTTSTIGNSPVRRAPRAAAAGAPVIVKRRSGSHFTNQAAILAVLIVVTALAWKYLKGMEAQKAAAQAAYNDTKGNAPATPATSPKPTNTAGSPKPKPKPEPKPEETTPVPDTGGQEIASGEDSGPDAGTTPTTPEATTGPDDNAGELPPAIVELETKAKSLVAALVTDRDKELTANAKTFSWELDSWIKTLNRSEQESWRPHVDQLKELATSERVPTRVDSDSGIELTERMARIAEFASRKQKTIDDTFLSKATKIRDAYVPRIKEAAAKALEAGQSQVAQTLESKAAAAADLESWLVSLGAKMPSEAAVTLGGSIVGRWSSENSETIFSFFADGTCKNSRDGEGTWTKDASETEKVRYVVSWKGGRIDRLAPEENGRILTGETDRGKKLRLSRKKKGAIDNKDESRKKDEDN